MPDWSYRPLFAPLMLRVAAASHRFVLATMRVLQTTPFYRVIDLMGHMLAPEPSPVGMSSVIDPEGSALRAFERFGYGFIEIGPVASESKTTPFPCQLWREKHAIGGPANPVPVATALANLQRLPSRTDVKRFVRVALTRERDFVSLTKALGEHADLFLVDAELAESAERFGKPWALCVRISQSEELMDVRKAKMVAIDPDDNVWRQADRERGLAAVAALRARHPSVTILYRAGGIESPRDAQAFVDAGANLITLSHGFVFSGPGTPKRINEALLYRAEGGAPEAVTAIEAARFAWFWCLVEGIALTLGALLAGFFALTRVILPYDEAASGLTRAQIAASNPHLLHFMAHDRFSLAGTMLSLGLLYCGLAWNGVRRGRVWAQEAVVFSMFAGYLTFFSFVAYGYFDQFHAFVAASLFPIAIQGAVGRQARSTGIPAPDLDNDRSWRLACIGQLAFVVEAVGLIFAGLIIMLVGSRHVFVGSDLAFLQTTAESLTQLHPNLVPLIAHDRATFGGMLFSTGLAVLFTAMWGFRRGERWLWMTLSVSGFPAYLATLWIHRDIGYTDVLHLSPVFIGLFLQLIGLVLTRKFLWSSSAKSQTPSRAAGDGAR